MKKPSDFLKVMPLASVFHRAEEESVAYGIMRLLSETGDEWRGVTWTEYRKRYLSDTVSEMTGEVKWYHSIATKNRIRKNALEAIEVYDFNCQLFFSVSGFCLSEEQAGYFSPGWKDLDGHVKQYGDRLEFIRKQKQLK